MLKNKTIVLVETNLFFAAKISAILRKLEAEVKIAKNFDAIQKNAETHPEIMILNLANPETDPLGIIRKLKGCAQTAAIPILGFCGHKDAALMQAAADAGCDRIIPNSTLALNLTEVLVEMQAKKNQVF